MIQKVKRGVVPTGTEVMIPIKAVHHDARAWGADATELVLRGYELRLSPACVHAPEGVHGVPYYQHNSVACGHLQVFPGFIIQAIGYY